MDIQHLANTLLNEPVVPAPGIKSIDQENEGEVIEVDRVVTSPYPSLFCWYNCHSHVKEHGGNIVFGWALFAKTERYLQAQNHAIWQRLDGSYLDITPESGETKTHFLIDGRMPFDYKRTKRAADFYLLKNGVMRWGSKENNVFVDHYFIHNMIADPMQQAIIKKIPGYASDFIEM